METHAAFSGKAVAHTVIVQKWEESERGWGTRPDGYSIHKTDSDLQSYIDSYWATMPDTAPETYSQPYGTPYSTEVDDAAYRSISGYGKRFYSNNYPGDGGTDGWR